MVSSFFSKSINPVITLLIFTMIRIVCLCTLLYFVIAQGSIASAAQNGTKKASNCSGYLG